MYAAVPISVPASVRVSAPESRAIPKSEILARPSSSKTTFAGFRSR
jgi:hypothetical protein